MAPDLDPRCIYCNQANDLCKAHIIPESLGSFNDLPKQKDLVCAACDNEIGKAEEQLAKCGFEAIMREHLGITGKKKHKKNSPFRRKYAGQGPIELKATFPGWNFEVLVEPMGDGKNTKPLPQLVLINTDGEYNSIRLAEPKKTSLENLKSALDCSSIKGDFRVIPIEMTDDEIDYIFNLLENIGTSFERLPDLTDDVSPERKCYPSVLVKGSIAVDARYFRAIAKIGLHYFLQYSDYFSGHENCLGQIKRFIRYGEGKIEQFVNQERGSLVSDIKHGFRPKYYGHFIIGDFRNNTATAYIQLFIGHDANPPYYRITIATNCLLIILPDTTFGHFFSYYPPEKRSHYAGEMQPLGAANKIQMPNIFHANYLDQREKKP
jgi:hypothetical protein